MRTPSSLDLVMRDLGFRALQRLSAGSTSSIERVGVNFQIRGPRTLSPAFSPRGTTQGSRSSPVRGPIETATGSSQLTWAAPHSALTATNTVADNFDDSSGVAVAIQRPTQADRTSVGQFLDRKRPNGRSAHPVVARAHLAGSARSCARRSASRVHLMTPEVTKSRVSLIEG
jgi:hypothetical protein